MRIVSLSDNTAADDKLFTENGFCLYIEHGGKKILFGAGASQKFLDNAKRLSVPAASADYCVIPHNHSSCTLGAESLVKVCPSVKFFIKDEAAADCYQKSGILKSRTGLPASFYRSGKQDAVIFNKFSEVCKDFYLVSNEFPSETDGSKSCYIKKNGRVEKDDFSQECFAVVFPGDRRKGCVVLTACSHCGITNIIKTVIKMWDCPIISVVGGFSLMGQSSKPKYSAEQISELAQEIAKFGTGAIYTCHCTGVKGYEMLKETLGDQLQYLRAGDELDF